MWWVPFQFQNHLSGYTDSHDKNKTALRPSYIYNGNLSICVTASLYGNNPVYFFGILRIFLRKTTGINLLGINELMNFAQYSHAPTSSMIRSVSHGMDVSVPLLIEA